MIIYKCETCGNTYKSEIEMTYPPECVGVPKPHLKRKVMKKIAEAIPQSDIQ